MDRYADILAGIILKAIACRHDVCLARGVFLDYSKADNRLRCSVSAAHQHIPPPDGR